MDDFVSAAEAYLEGVKSQILDTLFNSIGELDAASLTIISKVSEDINKRIDEANLTSVYARNLVESHLWNLSDIALKELGDLQRKVLDKIDEDASDTEIVVAAIKADISDALDKYAVEIVDGVTSIILKTEEPVKPEPVVVTPVPYEPPATWLDAIKAIPSALVGMSDALAMFSKLGDLANLKHSPDTLIKEAEAILQKKLEGFAWDSWGNLMAILGNVGSITGAPFGMLPVMMDSYSAGMGEVIHNVARVNFTPTRMAMVELVTAYIRGTIMEEKLFQDASELGFRPEDIEQYVNLARQLIPIDDLLRLWLRGELEEKELDNRLAQLGIASPDIKYLKTLTHLIPGVNDLIRMAVREAFTPEIAEKFGQYQGYPEELTEWAEKQGLSEEWAKRYWAAHWELPSIQMGFEMYQRKIIDLDTLNLLLRALDVMPYWRDRLIQMAYQPITRVDIRRMHKMGLLTYKQMVERYEAVAYSPEDARALADFTVELNKEEEKLEKQPERDLAASEIVSAYANVLIGEGDARALLIELGYNDYEIEFKMALADLPGIKRVKTKQIEIIRQRLLYGAIDLNGAVDELNKLDLPPVETEYQLLDFQQDLELQAFKVKPIKTKVVETPDRSLAKTDIFAAYDLGQIPLEVVYSLLLKLDYDNDEAALLIETHNAKLALSKAKEEAKLAKQRAAKEAPKSS